VALQLPMVEALLHEVGASHCRHALQRAWCSWTTHTVRLRALADSHCSRRAAAVVQLQRLARGRLARQLVQRLRQARRDEQQARHNAVLISFQDLVRHLQQRRRREQVLSIFASANRASAAMIIQRYYRGYMGRGEIVLLERKKLLKYLRKWSHGLTNKLYHLTGELTVTYSLADSVLFRIDC
jgi:hypothetical protein